MIITTSIGPNQGRSLRRLAPPALLALLLAACASTPPPPPPPPPAPVGPAQFSASDFAWSTGKGTNVIMGTVNYRPRTGPQWTCAGLDIALTPQTRYSRDRIITLYGSDVEAVQPVTAVRARTTPAPAEYAQYTRTTKCDAQNAFTFRDLPDGAYFLIARVRPVQPTGGEDVAVMDRVEVFRGMTLRTTMPRAPAAPAAAPAAAPRRQ